MIMCKRSIDSVILPPGPDFFYFTGFETEAMERLTLLVIGQNEYRVLCPSLMRDQLSSESWVDEIRAWNDDQDPYSLANDIIPRGTVAVGGGLPYLHYFHLRGIVGNDAVLADEIMWTLRERKDDAELAAISYAVTASEKSLTDIIREIKPGLTETAVARMLEQSFLDHGLQGPAFDTIVASGPNSAIPHHSPGGRKLVPGDPIVIDFGGRYKGYASDITRTYFIGKPDSKTEEIYQTVLQANEESRRMAIPDVTYGDMDYHARSIIRDHGYGEFFIHRLGHGIGISVHEPPYLVNGNREKLVEGSVFTIEPGIYIPGRVGVRIEDTNYFDGKSCRELNRLTRDLQIL